MIAWAATGFSWKLKPSLLALYKNSITKQSIVSVKIKLCYDSSIGFFNIYLSSNNTMFRTLFHQFDFFFAGRLNNGSAFVLFIK